MLPISDDKTTRHAPVASRTLILACCLIYLWQRFSGPWGELAGQALGFTPAEFFAGGTDNPLLAWVPFALTTVTYAFLHSGWLHLAGNMLFLWIFGDDVEDAFGQPGFIVFYLLAAMAAALAQAIPDPTAGGVIVGASGAVSGVLGAYLVLYPRAQINVLVPIFVVVDLVRLPAFVVLLFWIAVQVAYELWAPEQAGNIALRAHIGGFVAGMVMTPVFSLVARHSRERLSARAGTLLR
jgi:membrane associated rhomboid family serine protease